MLLCSFVSLHVLKQTITSCDRVKIAVLKRWIRARENMSKNTLLTHYFCLCLLSSRRHRSGLLWPDFEESQCLAQLRPGEHAEVFPLPESLLCNSALLPTGTRRMIWFCVWRLVHACEECCRLLTACETCCCSCFQIASNEPPPSGCSAFFSVHGEKTCDAESLAALLKTAPER